MNLATTSLPVIELLEFCLAEYGRIRALDEELGNLALRNTDRRAANAMRRMYEKWIEHAEALLRRAHAQGAAEQVSKECERLEDAVGRTLAMLSISLDGLDRADEEIRNGQTISIEEVRRELHARSRA